ncbi:hypothetical protein EDD15DRAFT_2226748 [Pisolithus albus]|nr:hypothetical protein EDD15DRAFT_2226748 [Pisolithus albus]
MSSLVLHLQVIQIYLYFMHYEDGFNMKILVSVIWILDTLHISFGECLVYITECMINRGLVCHILYYYLITNYGVPTSLDYIIWSLPVRVPIFLPDTF